MSRVTRTEWYKRTNAEWPVDVPELTGDEAVRAARKLYRFVTKRAWKGLVRVTSGQRRTRFLHGVLVVNPEQGWREFVHELSHWIPWREQYSNKSAWQHTAEHARLEARMIREVVRRGWLAGSLRTPDRPLVPPPDKRAVRRKRTEEAIARWEAKERRAVNALKKLRRRLKYYERVLG